RWDVLRHNGDKARPMRGRRLVKEHTPSRKPGTRGRPRQIEETERRQKVIEAAEQVFVAMGYGPASVDDIAHRAGMSKKTIYQVFDNKESLFAAVIAARRAELAAMVEAE